MAVFREMTELCSDVRKAEGRVRTKEFLLVCQKLVDVLDSLGPAFSLVKNDISKNIGVLDKQYTTNPAKYCDMYGMVLEDARQAGQGDGTCACSLLWLKRAMEFLLRLVANLVSQRSLPMQSAVADAYEKTLRPYHSFAVRMVISGVTRAVPSRQSVEDRIGGGQDIVEPGKSFVVAFTPIIEEVHHWLLANQLAPDTKA
eukprot:EG_transcript_17119